jgi:hypothetical protein
MTDQAKSPVCTSTQVTAEFQAAHKLELNDVPEDKAVHHWPL